MNKFIGMGNLTGDPELKEVKGDKKVCTFSIAINSNVDKSVIFIDIETWNKTAENCSRFLSKGRKVLIEGRLKLNSWKSKEGENRSKMYCSADIVTFLSGNPSEGEGPKAHNQKTNQEPEEEDEFADIPF